MYALASDLREMIAREGHAKIAIDLRPEMSVADLATRLSRPRGGDSLSNFLRKSIALSPVGINLLREAHANAVASDPAALARQIKSAPLTLTGTQGLERAISTAGGVSFDAVDDDLMLRAMPNVYAVGEMLDWEAPTGGYLLQATFATAVAAARAILRKDAKR
jgi:predicted flavoprotein YhiN